MNETKEQMTRENFWSWLREHKNGELHHELGEKLQELTTAVMMHDKVGTLTLQLKIAPTKDGRTVFITDELKTKVPEPDRGGQIMFVNQHGCLTKRDPNQMSMPVLMDAAEKILESGDLTVDTETGEVVASDRV